jgi:hypothetical protein
MMNLLDLADDELIPIFQRVDHKTKLNLMLVCKRFENVIGSYLELFGGFKLEVRKEHLESPDRVQTLTQMRRHLGRIKIHGRDLNLDTEVYNLFFQLLTKIGSKLLELVISSGKICFASLVNLLKLTPNIAQLEVLGMNINPRTDFDVQIKLGKLIKFDFRRSSNIEIFEKILKPNSLSEIKIIRPEIRNKPNSDVPANYWTVIPRILSKQEKLVSLELDHCTITNFPDSPEIWALKNLLKLSLGMPIFYTPKDFENFTKFIKSLDKLTELNLNQLEEKEDNFIDESEDEDDSDMSDYEEIAKNDDFAEILAHLLFLPTLTKLSFVFFNWNLSESILNLKMQNPSVEDLTMNQIENRYTNCQYMEIFPNIRRANVKFCRNPDEWDHENDMFYEPDLTPFNSWTLLEELKLRDFGYRMLLQIDVKTLHCLKIDNDWDFEPEYWHYFCSKHPQLERLEIGGKNFINLLVVVENLPNLKSLIFKGVEGSLISEKKAIKMIAKKCAKLEHLEFELKKMKAETAVAVLKEKLPSLRGFIKQIDENYKILDIIEI